MGDEIRWLEEVDGNGALVLLGFPTTGAVGSIVAQYLIESLDLPLVGSLHLQNMMPVVAVRDGRAVSPIVIHGGEVACNLEGDCPRLFVITTNLDVAPPLHETVVETVMKWAKEEKVSHVVCIEGLVRETGDDTPDVYIAGATPRALEALRETRAGVLERAVLGGIPAVLLATAADDPCRGAILVEATRDQPDGLAAAAIVKALDPLIENVNVDEQPLLEEAMQLQKAIDEQRKSAKMDTKPPSHTFI